MHLEAYSDAGTSGMLRARPAGLSPFAPRGVPARDASGRRRPAAFVRAGRQLERGRYRSTWLGQPRERPGAPADLERRVRRPRRALGRPRRRWNTKPARYSACRPCASGSTVPPAFADHLKRYSKSRRQAPICGRSLHQRQLHALAYYHRLNDQTLTCVTDL